MRKIKYFYVYWIFLLSISLWSQESAQEFRFNNIKEGIGKTGVTNMIQDHYGFIWIGTYGTGLYRFDGIDFLSYKHRLKDPTSLSNSRIKSSYLDSKNRLWFGTENGLNLYNREQNQFKRIALDPKNSDREFILSLEEDSSNNLLIGTKDLGLFKLNLTTFKVQKILNSTSQNGESINCNSIQHTQQGKTFVGTNFGLKEWDLKNNKLIQTRLYLNNKTSIDSEIQTLFIDASNALWIGSQGNKGLLKCVLSNDVRNNVLEIKELNVTSKKIMTIVELVDKTLLIGTENDGLFHIKNDGALLKNYISSKKEENSILHNSIWSLIVDKDNRIWMGYFNSGVAVSDKFYDKFLDIKSLANNDNSLKTASVTGLIEDSFNAIWIATDGGGIDIRNPKTTVIQHINSRDNSNYSGLTSDYIKTLFLDSKQNIWAGSWDSGVFFLKKGQKNFLNFNTQNTSGNLKSNTIVSFSEDSKGVIWIGTFQQGLHSYDPKTNTFKKHDSSLFKQYGLSTIDIRKVYVDSDDAIWLGTINGLFKLEVLNGTIIKVIFLGNKMTAEYKNPSDANHILSIYQSSNKNIWIGTRGAGLCKYDKTKNTFVWYNKFKGLNEENVSAIIQDNNGNLWISGNTGLTKMNLKDYSFTNYTISDGLLSNDFNYGSVLKSSNGMLHFGNFKGVDYFNPKQIQINNIPPSLYLTDFKLFNEKVFPKTESSPLEKVISETKSITLTDQQSVFTIEYSGINYTRPSKNSYAYYLEGYESSWNYVGQIRNATYTNLDPGDYVFKVKAANNDGIWSKTLELKIKILPPWWKTNWAIMLYLALFLFGLYLLNQITKKRIKEKELIKNERILQKQNDELNNKKIQFFTNISHEFRTPLTLILNPLKDIINSKELIGLPQNVKNKHAIIYKNADRLYRLINELMDLRKIEHNKMNVRAGEINLLAFTKSVAAYFQEEAFRKNILLNLEADLPDIIVWADADMLEKIIFNLLSNAIKFTPDGGAITVELLSKDQLYLLPLVDDSNPVKTIEIKISDTGHGLETDEVPKIFERFYQVEGQNKTYFGGTGIGLEVVLNFVKLHKGLIDVTSDVGLGTTFKIVLPSGNEHFEVNEIVINENSTYPRKEAFLAIPSVEIINQSVGSTKFIKTFTLLIVEDNVDLRDYLHTELKDHYNVLLANNGKEGVEIAKKSFPDVILTDVIMPEMNGFEFCKIIKKEPSTSHIPLLMLTAKATTENRIEGIENGADAYMVKPFDLKLLKLQLEQLIKSRQLIFDKYFSAISGVQDNLNAASFDKEFIEKLLNYINNAIDDSNLSVEEIAIHLNLSRSQFYRKVKALTGQTPNEFIRKIRLERAKQILEKGNSNISEVCYSVGFATPSYFSKCFKAHFGVLPTEIVQE